MEKATQLAFVTFTNYLNSTADYHFAYESSIQACKDLFGDDAPELESVIAAWFAVGIPHSTHIQQIPTYALELSVYPNPAQGHVQIDNLSGKELSLNIMNIQHRNSRE